MDKKDEEHTSQIEDLNKDEMFADISLDSEEEDAPTVQLEDIKTSEAFADIEIEQEEVVLDDDEDDRPTVLLNDIQTQGKFSDKADLGTSLAATKSEDDDYEEDDEDDRPTVLLEDLNIQDAFADLSVAEDEQIAPIATKKVKAPHLPTPPAPEKFTAIEDKQAEDIFSELRTDSNVPPASATVQATTLDSEKEVDNIFDLRPSVKAAEETTVEKVVSIEPSIFEGVVEEKIASVNVDEKELEAPDQLRVQTTIRQLREERNGLYKEIASLKQLKALLDQENLGLRSELDETKIELSFIKKRAMQEIDSAKNQLKVYEDRLLLSEDKNKKYKQELEKVGQRLRVDYNQVKHREQELENQLELMRLDAHAQIEVRDKKILELQRKIDTLEFNMENIIIQDQRSREEKAKMEERLNGIMLSLKSSVSQIENEVDFTSGIKARSEKRLR
ncbi:MAG: hypothetical protein A2504_15260 [Bdellovibrionales bacterium RIFOXYD12_FULL_39_22]|nr:MAG: hypothetical protein A2385_02690 [Bdellovibrionales bacterium RIFOXYB1_FULL_39_21]OFZ43154.1 MAG: hypothetical protein A2485_11835 [Bdellovibrionales bacterium RIFOXYC12_FULL_39_17]OFZ47892.1 MAG: hypothetical protein A2404_16475 [Bdellovibrionales bacterium RIFOXYC1_FULL_39_130]OFZ74838.1 MAG: hypothetical protein A2451_03295 [Bdellovibrionales bacterium RIFOXYC2_FULL_39_8]OFZ75672.1 MAG: hypothetical protein A2560_12975 [Bdellovibrionales bacterium RIFOXYD1_FULL_39_84]OFZ94162.1 MAG: